MNEDSKTTPKGEQKILSHEPVPGYRTAFYITVAAGLIWLLLAFTGAL